MGEHLAHPVRRCQTKSKKKKNGNNNEHLRKSISAPSSTQRTNGPQESDCIQMWPRPRQRGTHNSDRRAWRIVVVVVVVFMTLRGSIGRATTLALLTEKRPGTLHGAVATRRMNVMHVERARTCPSDSGSGREIQQYCFAMKNKFFTSIMPL